MGAVSIALAALSRSQAPQNPHTPPSGMALATYWLCGPNRAILAGQFMHDDSMASSALPSETPDRNECDSKPNGCRYSRDVRISGTCISCPRAKSSVCFPSRLLSHRFINLFALFIIPHQPTFLPRKAVSFRRSVTYSVGGHLIRKTE